MKTTRNNSDRMNAFFTKENPTDLGRGRFPYELIPQCCLDISNVVLSLKLIELKFEKFDVERDNYCRYDFVAVFNGGEVNDAKRIGKYCGDSPPA